MVSLAVLCTRWIRVVLCTRWILQTARGTDVIFGCPLRRWDASACCSSGSIDASMGSLIKKRRKRMRKKKHKKMRPAAHAISAASDQPQVFTGRLAQLTRALQTITSIRQPPLDGGNWIGGNWIKAQLG